MARDMKVGGSSEAAAGGRGTAALAVPGKATLTGNALHEEAEAGVAGGGGGALPFADKIQESFGPRNDVGSIRAHVGGQAGASAGRIGADAYATRNQIAFRGAPNLHTAAHEAAHVMQQRDGVQLFGGVGKEGDAHERNADAVADRVVQGKPAADLLPKGGGKADASGGTVQMRRVPTNATELLTDPGDASKQNENYAADADGLKRLIAIAEKELSKADRAKVDVEQRAGLKDSAAFNALPEKDRLARRANAINKVRPDLALGDPHLIDTGPRPATPDAANIALLVNQANTVFITIASGAADKDIENVFGATKVGDAKGKYAKAQAAMNKIFAAGKILTDRSGYNDEVNLGGLTTFNEVIRLAPGAIDSPTGESVGTLIHESMHAGNSDVVDKGYIGQPDFKTSDEARKLTNAAHFEVVARQLLKLPDDFKGIVFAPAGTSVTSSTGAVTTAPSNTPREQAIADAAEQLRWAWDMAINLHSIYLQIFKDPVTQWPNFDKSIPFWSKVEKLTVHNKAKIEPASPNAALRPISTIDMALAEGIIRKLAAAQASVPMDDKSAGAYETQHSHPDVVKAVKGDKTKYRDLYVRMALHQTSHITGTDERDLRAIDMMATLRQDWANAFTDRDPSSFAD